ncbi:ABC transporter substrate-binding protein [Acidisphaera sp. L21]|uniref:ABC transporter substrate-binding protein n=1 Tax=Acidisphaera sp. L21 TaxID=1641851 RepID=UPI00131CFBEE|nr:ABC transporter substrate-binding protein [Acidisphaera sp. L21]
MTDVTRRVALASGLAATAIRARAQTRPVRIGIVNDPNGVYADNGGVGCVIATRLAAAEIGNIVLGRPIEILHGDCANKPDLAASITREWIDSQGVDLIVDGANSAAGLAIQQVTREKQRIYVAIGPATSDLTGKACSPFCFHFSYDTYALAKGTGDAVTKAGGKTWFFITADYAFGDAMQRDTTRFLEAAGGKVLGTVRHPLGTSDFSSYLLQAQNSGAQVIGLANAGTDTQNTLKQAAEFGVGTTDKQRLAALLIFVTDVFSVGLPVAQGLNLTTSFYWDRTDETRAFTKQFMLSKPKPPTMLQAGSYSGVKHWLAAVAASGTTDAKTVAAKMRATPVNDMNNTNVTIRGDGRVMCNMYLAQVKTPAESHGQFDVYKILATLPGEQAFRPVAEGGCPLVT